MQHFILGFSMRFPLELITRLILWDKINLATNLSQLILEKIDVNAALIIAITDIHRSLFTDASN